jgi:transketolase
MKYPIPFDERELKLKAIQMRRDIVAETHAAGSGHPGGSLSATDMMTVLYNSILRHDSENPSWEDRDRFILSKAHISPAYYSILARTGYFSPDELTGFRQFGHFLQGHPKTDVENGIEIGGGSLGQNLSIAVGLAIGLKKRGKKGSRVFDMSSEGELQEGSMWEAIMAAAHFKLNNLCIMIDYNRLQIDGPTELVMEVEPLDKKFESFNWNVIEINGHNIKEIYEAFKKFNLLAAGHKVPDHDELDPEKPTAIIARTVKGKGISFMENQAGWHGRAPKDDEFELANKELDEAKATIENTTEN